MSVLALVQSAAAVPSSSDLGVSEVDQARDLTSRTRDALHTAAAAVERALTLVAEARDTGAWAVLGYKNFASYAEVELVGLSKVRFDSDQRDRRIALVRGLLGEGLSRRAIGRVMKVSDQTVRADLELAELQDQQPEVTELEVIDGEVLEESPARTLTQPELALQALAEAGLKGLTSVEVGRRYRSWDSPWAVLSRLHSQGRIARLAVYEPTGTREHKGAKYAVYTSLEHLEGRDAEQPGRQRGMTLALAITAAA